MHIPLTRGYTAIVDAEWYDQLNAHRWHATSDGYAARNVRDGDRSRTQFMHRYVWELAHGPIPDGKFVQHIDPKDRANNVVSNLRLADDPVKGHRIRQRPRAGNRTGYVGVYLTKSGKYVAQFRNHYLGVFGSAAEAGEAYQRAAREMIRDS